MAYIAKENILQCEIYTKHGIPGTNPGFEAKEKGGKNVRCQIWGSQIWVMSDVGFGDV